MTTCFGSSYRAIFRLSRKKCYIHVHALYSTSPSLHVINTYYEFKIHVISITNNIGNKDKMLFLIRFEVLSLLPMLFVIKFTFIFYFLILITCKRTLVLYEALLILYNIFRAQPEDGSKKGAETC